MAAAWSLRFVLLEKGIPMIDIGQVLQLQQQCVARWHAAEIDQPCTGILGLICQQHAFNFRLWHEEDQARCPQASDAQIANVKRAIDKLNQQRNDWIEKIDEWLVADLAERQILPVKAAPRNTETPGSGIDRLSILALRLYHLDEQLGRADLDGPLRASIQSKLDVGRLQRADLAQSLGELLEDIYRGRKRHGTYRQMKMYNDPQLNPYLVEAGRKAG